MNNTTTAKVNKIDRLFVLTEIPNGEHARKDMKTRGWDGTTWMGVSKAEGRKMEACGLFFRSLTGQFSMITFS